MMSVSESQQSTAIAMELMQSVGMEITIFAITLALAAAFHGVGTPFRKKSCSVPTSPKSTQAKRGGASGRTSSQCNKVPVNQSHGLAQTEPHTHCPTVSTSNGLCKKIKAIVDHASWRQDSDALAIYAEMKTNGEHTDIKDCLVGGKKSPADVYGVLVQCAGRLGRPDLVAGLLDDMVSARIDRSLGFYESTMKMLAAKKCYKEALSVCSQLEADGLEPSPVTLSCLINFAVESGESDRAICFFNRLASTGKPSIRAYMTILRVYSRRSDWSKSLALLRDMQERQGLIDSLVLNMVLATGVAAGQLDAAMAVLKEFSQMKIADVISCNTVMKGFAQQKQVDKAIKLLDEICEMGLKPNAITFNTAMDAAVRSAHVADAWRVLARMRDAGLAPDKFTCTTLMKGLQNGATSEQLTMILDLLRNVTADCDSALCGVLFRTVIEAAAQVNEPSLTARAVAQMREQRVMLSTQDYQRLLQVLLRQGEAQPRRAVRQVAHAEGMRPVRAC